MQRYSDEIGYVADKNKNRVCSYAKSPEDLLIENECREEIEEWKERQERIDKKTDAGNFLGKVQRCVD